MQLAWVIVPKCVTLQDLRAALSALDRPVELGPASRQIRIKASAPLESDDRLQDDNGLEDIEEDELDRIHASMPDPAYYLYRYHVRPEATHVLKTIASSHLADGPMLITDGNGWSATGPEFLQRLEQDPEWWDWWRRQGA